MAEKQRLSESDTIILSLHDRWWGKVLAGEKPLEIRKRKKQMRIFRKGGSSRNV